jgi:hypothetical protein
MDQADQELEVCVRVKGLSGPERGKAATVIPVFLMRSLYLVDADPETFRYEITVDGQICKEGPER